MLLRKSIIRHAKPSCLQIYLLKSVLSIVSAVFFSLIGIYGHMELLFAIHKHVCVSCQLSCICLFSYSVSVHLCRHNCEGSRQKFRARMFFAVSPRRFSVRGLCVFFHLCFVCMIRFCNIRMKELLSE